MTRTKFLPGLTLTVETPVRCYLPPGIEPDPKEFAYRDGRVDYEYQKYRKMQRAEEQRPGSTWFAQKHGNAVLDAKVAELDAERRKSVLFRDDVDGRLYTYSGLAHELAERHRWIVQRTYALPEPRRTPWDRKIREPRPYQDAVVEQFIRTGHAAAELATGLGKSLIACMLVRYLGLPALVVCPTLSIAEQLHSDLTTYMGAKRVGRYFDGCKEPFADVVVAVSASLLRVQPDSAHGRALSSKAVLIGDESHMLPAECLSRVVLGLLGNIPWRFFLSGTQIRTDGLDLVLRGILGPVTHRMSVRDGVQGGWLAPFSMHQYLAPSPHPGVAETGEPVAVNRAHLHRNQVIYRHVGRLLRAGLAQGRRPLVLMEEVAQFPLLLPHLPPGIRLGFAHGGLTSDKQRDGLPQNFWKSDPRALVHAFDAGQMDVLVGTQCIGIGTDIRSASLVCDLVGGTSEVRLRQNVGRGSRLFPGKSDCVYVDYGVRDVPLLEWQADRRMQVLDEIYGPTTRHRVN